ncbi:MAG: sugar nucleotide-binding protein, partial [Culicoidibacterales bacterium]
MKILVTGYNGQLGYDVVRECEKHGIEAIGIDVAQLDITDEAAVVAYMDKIKP